MCNQNVRELLLKNYSTKSLRCSDSDSQQTPPVSPSDSPSIITDLIEGQIQRQLQQQENREKGSTIELDLENGIEETNRTS
jgi:hypothetical protein